MAESIIGGKAHTEEEDSYEEEQGGKKKEREMQRKNNWRKTKRQEGIPGEKT